MWWGQCSARLSLCKHQLKEIDKYSSGLIETSSSGRPDVSGPPLGPRSLLDPRDMDTARRTVRGSPALLLLLLGTVRIDGYRPVVIVHGIFDGPKQFKTLSQFITEVGYVSKDNVHMRRQAFPFGGRLLERVLYCGNIVLISKNTTVKTYYITVKATCWIKYTSIKHH